MEQPNVIGAATGWLEKVLTGPVGLGVATLAVAAFGFLLLSGRVDARRAIQVIAGCFFLFGASSIAAGIVSSIQGASEIPTAPAMPDPSAQLILPNQAHAPVADPYAGAAVPRQR